MARANVKDWLTEEGLLLIEGWARDGLTDVQIAENIGCSRSTLAKWKKEQSDIADTLKKGKEVVDRQVENALFKRAVGFHFVEEVATPSGDVVQLTKYERPDVTAGIYWLRNRKRGIWNNKDGIEIEKSQLEIEKLKRELQSEETTEDKLSQLMDSVDKLAGDE